MKSAFYVYVHMKPDLTPFYVGKGSLRRARTLGVKGHRSDWHTAIVNKYGKENIIIETHECASEREAFFREIAVIAALRNAGCDLCNMTGGGEGTTGYRPTAEQRKRRSEFMKNHPERLRFLHDAPAVRTEEYRKKLSAAAKGRRHSDETKAKISTAKRNPTDETRARLSAAKKGKPLTEEHKHNLALAALNCSDETRRKLSEAARNVSEETRRKRSESMKAYITSRRNPDFLPTKENDHETV